MDFILNGHSFRTKYYGYTVPAFISQRNKLIGICKVNAQLAAVKTALLSDLMESIVCKRAAQWISAQPELPNEAAIAKEVTYQISKELIRQKVGDKIPLLIQESQKINKSSTGEK